MTSHYPTHLLFCSVADDTTHDTQRTTHTTHACNYRVLQRMVSLMRSPVLSLATLPNGLLVAGAENNKITVWDVDAGTSLISTGPTTRHTTHDTHDTTHNATLTAHVCVRFIQINKCVVWCICEFVRRITQPKQVIKTMMNAHNLAIVFAPSLLRYSRGFLTTPVPPVISTHVTDTAPWRVQQVWRPGDHVLSFDVRGDVRAEPLPELRQPRRAPHLPRLTDGLLQLSRLHFFFPVQFLFLNFIEKQNKSQKESINLSCC